MKKATRTSNGFSRLGFIRLFSFLPLALMAIVNQLHAQPVDRVTIVLAQATKISKSKAAEIARERYGGKVLKVTEVSKGSTVVYRVKLLLDSGRVKLVTIDGSGK